MKTEHKAFLLCLLGLLGGLVFWVLDTTIDCFIFHEGAFLDLLILDVPGHELYHRGTAFLAFVGLGLILAAFTARRRTGEEALKYERDQLFRAFEAIEDGVYIVDQQYDIRYVNPVLVKDFGPVDGRKCYTYFHDRTAPCPWCKNEEVWAGRSVRWEWHSFKNDRTYDLLDTPLKNPDGSVWKLEVFRDITDRKRNEEEVENLAKFPSEDPYPVLRIADDGTTLYANAAATALLADSNSAVGGPAPEPWRQLSRRVLATGLPDALEEAHGQHTVLFSATPVPDKRYVNVYGVDITARRRAEQERKRLIAELETKNAELERFTYTVSHDLKGPLITIKGFAGLLEKDIADGDAETTEQDLARIKKAADRMHQLLDELLDLSRVGRVTGPPEDVPLSDLAREAMELMALRAGESGVEIHIPPDLPVVRGDRPRLLSVMQNLMDNAVKFMGDQVEPRIEIGGRHDGGETLCWVRDNGIGIDPRYHDRVFGLFDQLHRGTSEGTGIGLAITKRVVEVHGGRIWLESEGQGRGSTFCFALPRKGGSANGEDQ